MKLTFLLGVVFLSFSAMALPVRSPNRSITIRTGDISLDKDFIRSVQEVATLQSKISSTNSVLLITKSMMGTLTNAEKEKLAANLGYTDYDSFTSSLDRITLTIISLKEKYAGVSDQEIATAVSNTSSNLYTTGGGGGGTPGTPNPCLTQLYKDIFTCIKSTGNCWDLRNCIQSAYVKYNTCKTGGGPR